MKGLLTFAGLTLTGSLALAQGTVWFSNHQGQLVDAPFYDDQGRALEGATYLAQLYFWKPDGGFQPAANPVPFNTNGYFFGSSVVLDGIHECGAAWVQVRAWDSRAGATFAEAALAGAWTGVSSSLFVSPVGSPSRPEACIPAILIGLTYPGSPLLVLQPLSKTVRGGQSTSLAVVASSGVAVSYQWYQQPSDRPDGLIVGATNATYTTSALSTNTTYWVSITNFAGSVFSDKATVTVVPAAPRLALQLTAGLPVLTLEGPVGATYRIEYSTNLNAANWTSLVELSLSATPFIFSDSGWSNSPARFYRAIAP